MSKQDLSRFLIAQENSYATALSEIRKGKKTSHWMWWIFPQLVGLGQSHYAQLYGIKDRAEAVEYLAHPILGARLIEISSALLLLEGDDASAVMGRPDDMKLNSSMTLFASLSETDPIFLAVIDKYYSGQQDEKTLRMLKEN